MSTNFEDIRTILNRIDGVNVPVQEGHYPHIKSFDKLYGIKDMQQYKAMADGDLAATSRWDARGPFLSHVRGIA